RGRGADAAVRAAPQPRDVSSLGQLEGFAMKTPQRWGTIPTRFATFAAWVDDAGRVTRFWLRADGAAEVDPDALHDEDAIAHVREQVEEYCAGTRREFTLELAARGSPFQHKVWDAVRAIPFGATASYG